MIRQVPIFIFTRGRSAFMKAIMWFSQTSHFYIGRVPVFWWPYLYQSLNDAFNFTVSPAYLSSWGPSLLTEVIFPITDDIKGQVPLGLPRPPRRGCWI